MATTERYYELTPAGGDYSEIIYFNDDMEKVDSSIATKCVIRECSSDGKILMETWGSVKKIGVSPEVHFKAVLN